jgi:intracellular sulfur oxidation DsrE/DsrF family protein
MKTLMPLIGLQLIVFLAVAQTKPVKIVFDVTSRDTLTQQTAIRHVTLMAESYPQSYFEVVIYGGALNMVVNGKSTVSKAIQKLEGNSKVSFKVCEYTMKRAGVDKSQLLPGVGTVPDGIIEIVTKQGEGWGYIKEANN